jgi:uncharacterized protein YbaP (TraB family)
MRCFFRTFLFVLLALEGPLSFAAACPNRLLFELSRAGAQAYVFGTNHSGETVAPTLSLEAMSALKLSGSVYFETARTERGNSSSSVALSFGEAMRLPPGQRLSSLLDEDLYGQVSAAFARIPRGSVLLAGLERRRPLLVVLVLISLHGHQSLAVAPTQTAGDEAGKFSLDNTIFDAAKQERKPIRALEDGKTLAQSFDLSIEREIEALRAALALLRSEGSQRELASKQKSIARLLRDGEIDLAVESQAEAYRSVGLSDLFRVIFDERNEFFVKRIEELSQPGHKPFFAIGALHLGGRSGVLQSLRDRGFVVKAVPKRPSCYQ